MTQGGVVALLALLVAQLGQVVSSWVQTSRMNVQIAELRRGIAKENANRRMQLEDKVDDLYRYIDRLREHLIDWVDKGYLIISDRDKVDMNVLIPPPRPKYNGDDRKAR